MKRHALALVMVVAAALTASGSSAQSARQGPPDAVTADPKHYTVEFENDIVRVLRVRVGAGESAPAHRHDAYCAIEVSDSSLREGNGPVCQQQDGTGVLRRCHLAWPDQRRQGRRREHRRRVQEPAARPLSLSRHAQDGTDSRFHAGGVRADAGGANAAGGCASTGSRRHEPTDARRPLSRRQRGVLRAGRQSWRLEVRPRS